MKVAVASVDSFSYLLESDGPCRAVRTSPATSEPDRLTQAEMGAAVLDPTPLWFYILKEAELLNAGLHLGPIAGRIVAEVLLGLLSIDKTSWVDIAPAWKPTIPTSGDRPTLADIVTYTTGG